MTNIVKIQAKRNHLWLLACGLPFLTSPAIALEINNNTGHTLNIKVECGAQEDTFEVSPNQVGYCPSNICGFNTTCKYTITTTNNNSCSGRINGGSGLQVDASSNKLHCLSYGG
jgi:hypothetical protein